MENWPLKTKRNLLFLVALILGLMTGNIFLYLGLNYYDQTSPWLRWLLYPIALPFGTALALGWLFNRVLNNLYRALVGDFERHFFNNFFIFGAVWIFFALGIHFSESWGIRSDWNLKQRGHLQGLSPSQTKLEQANLGYWSFEEAVLLDLSKPAYYTYFVTRTNKNQRSRQDFYFWAFPLLGDWGTDLSVWWISRLERPKPPLEGIRGGRLLHDLEPRNHFLRAIEEAGFKSEQDKTYVFIEEDTGDFESLLFLANRAVGRGFAWYNLGLALILGLWTAKGLRTFKA